MEVGRWSEGRPVFKKVDGEPRFLLMVKEGWIDWNIMMSTTSTAGSEVKIESGRGTNSPASPEAGPSVRYGVTKWRYFASGWKEGVISVTCL